MVVTNDLPGYTFGGDEAYQAVPQIVGQHGRKVCVIGGETALTKAMPVLRPVLEMSELVVTGEIIYGKECSFNNSEKLAALPAVQEADVLLAIGGGKAIDSVKLISHFTGGKPMFTFPTVAGTCAATTKVAAVYHENHVFNCAHYNPSAPLHCFINSRILVEAPERFIWAGMGDTVAKQYETAFSGRGQDVPYEIQMGITIAQMCGNPILQHGVQALEAAKKRECNASFEQMLMAVIFSTGLASNFLSEDFNSSIAHAMCYGFTTQKVIEERHLHGEIVSYGVLVLLTVDGRLEERDQWIAVYKKMGLPTKLADLDMSMDVMDEVFAKALLVRDTKVAPYPITEELLRKAVMDLEAL